MNLVSIVTPMYNSEQFICQTINSVMNQTYEKWELILVDDCSSDNTVALIKKKYGYDNRVKIIKLDENVGAGAARNIGLEHASGQLIAFLDGDDIWHKSKLKNQLEFMSNNDSAIVHTGYSFINDKGNKIPGRVNVSEVVDLNSYMRNTEIGMSTSLINKKIVGEFSLNTMRTRQDTKLWLTLLGRGFLANGLNEDLVSYRIRNGQISGNKIIIAWRTLRLYLTVKDISLFRRFLNFSFYAFHAISKRLIK